MNQSALPPQSSRPQTTVPRANATPPRLKLATQRAKMTLTATAATAATTTKRKEAMMTLQVKNLAMKITKLHLTHPRPQLLKKPEVLKENRLTAYRTITMMKTRP